MKTSGRDGSKNGKFPKTLNIRMEESEYEELKAYAEEKNLSVSETVRRAVRLFFYQTNLRKKAKK